MQQKGSQSWPRQAVLCFFNKPELLSMCITEGTSSSWQGRQPGGTKPLQHLQRTSPQSKIAWLKHLPAPVTPKYMNCNIFTNTICGCGAHTRQPNAEILLLAPARVCREGTQLSGQKPQARSCILRQPHTGLQRGWEYPQTAQACAVDMSLPPSACI